MIRILFLYCLFTLLLIQGHAQFSVSVQVNVVQPVPPYLPQIKADIMGNRAGRLNQDITSHLSILLRYTGQNGAQRIKLAGTIERVSPSLMSVSLRPDFQPAQPIILGPNQPMLALNKDMLQTAFGNFSENSLVFTNCDLNTLRQNGIDYKLPEGTYRICVTAYDYDKPGFSAPLSPPGTGCGYFTICYTASAPQLILPVTTFVQNNTEFQSYTPHSNQVQFTWTPPASTCGMPTGPLTYDLEIRRVYSGQTVSDAVNNPYVFHQQFIPTTTFLLDTLKYAHVLVSGQQYIIRIKANFIAMIGSPLEIANQGYSEIGAFTWAPVTYFPITAIAANLPNSQPSKPLPPGSIQPGGYINEPYTPTAACVATTPISNTTPLTGSLTGSPVTIDGFSMSVTQATANSDGSFKGTGTITWQPFSSQLSLSIAFDSLRVNTDRVVYAGTALTASANGFPGFSVFGAAGTDPVSKLTGLDDNTLSSINNRINIGANLLNQVSGGTPVTFPLGLSTTLGGAPTTVAVMGISFKPSCTNMNVLFGLNVTDLGGWLALAGTGFSIDPHKLLANTGGVLYMPQDRTFSTGGMKFDLNGCPDAGSGAVDTSKGVYVQWDATKGLSKIVANADIQFTDNNAIVAVDKNDQRLTTPAAIHARFSFSDWNDWLATATLNNDFELAGLPGFPIHSDGLFFDHSTTQNPAGIAYPTGYTGAQDAGFEGLYIPDLSMSLPSNFKTFSGSKTGGISFQHFILDNSGVTTTISATNVLDISTGSLGGWAFSIDKISIGIVQNNFQNGMQMSGQIKLPIASDALNYTCALNSADGKVNYQFVAQPSGDLTVPLWLAQINLDPNSSLTIGDDNNGMVVKTHLNGGIGISIQAGSFPKVSLPALSFQDMAMANRADTNANAAAGFYFSPGAWSLGGGIPIPASLTQTTALGDGYAFSGPNDGDAASADAPEMPAGLTAAPSYDDGSSQGTIAGFSLNLSDFKPYFNPKSLTSVEAGVYFTVKVGIGFGDAFVVSGAAHLGILGTIDIPGSKAPSASFEKIDCDSVAIEGGIGPVNVHGSLAFINGDGTYGDGVKGSLSADFTFAQLNAAAQFGTTLGSGGFHYWAIGGSVFMDAGIPIGPGLMVNGFGGGAFHNMNLTKPSDDEIRSHPSTSPGTIPMVPQLNTDGIQAEMIISVLEPTVCNGSVTLTGTIVNGGLGQLRMDGAGFIITNAPDNTNAMVQANMVMVYDFVQKTFDLNVAVNVHFLIATATGQLWMHGGPDGDYLYIGQPDPDKRISLTLIKIGNPGDDLYVDLGATAYFDAGTELPAFPPLPPLIASNLDKGGNDNAVYTMLQLIGNAKPPNPGFMFGADVQGHVRLSLLFLYAQVDAELGFDVAMEHVTNPPSGCIQSDGSFGLNNWYGMGQFYAYFDLQIGLHVDAWFYSGDVDLVEEKAWCVLQAGLPNPSWVNGEVHVEGSALGGLVHVSGDFPFSFGSECNIPFNPLDDIQMITDIGPKDSASVFADPVAAYSVPMNDEDYPIQVPPDDKHSSAYTRTFRFSVTQFQLFKEKSDGSDSLTAGMGDNAGFAMSDDGLGSSLYPSTMLQPHARYKMYVQCHVNELVNNSLVTPAGSSGYQDTTYYFTTGAAPDHIVAENVAYSYPIAGQHSLLKNEFGAKGQIKMGSWQYNILPQSTPQLDAVGAGYAYLVYFISEHGDTLTSNFTLNQANSSLDFPIPAGLANNTVYDMQVWVKPKKPFTAISFAPTVNKQFQTTTNQVTNKAATINSQGKVSTQSTTLISSVAVAKNLVTMPTTVHPLGTIPIYGLRFQTSQYSSFTDKISAYGGWASAKEDAYRDIMLTAGATSPEEFDEFEIKGYSSGCQTCDPKIYPSSYPAMFGAAIPWNNNVQNDKYASDNLYANAFQLAFYNVVLDLGSPEVRDLMKPDNCLSTDLMPFQPKLPALAYIPAKQATETVNIPTNATYKTAGNKTTTSGSSESGPPFFSANTKISLPSSYMTTSGSSNTTTSQNNSSGNNTAMPNVTGTFLGSITTSNAMSQTRLVWKHDNYIYADYQLLQQFGNTFITNQQQMIYMPGEGTIPTSLAEALAYGNDVTFATGEYGSITMDSYYYMQRFNNPTLTGIANTLRGLSFQPLPASSHTLQLKYSYPFCFGCNFGSTVPVNFNYGNVIYSSPVKAIIR